jgi:hypothetical protein
MIVAELTCCVGFGRLGYSPNDVRDFSQSPDVQEMGADGETTLTFV